MKYSPYFYSPKGDILFLMRLIVRYIRPYAFLAVTAPLCVLLEVWAELAQPELMARIVDRGILGGEEGVIMPTCLKMVAIMLLGVAGGLFSIHAAGRVAYGLGARMRADAYDRLLRLPLAEVDRLGVPSLLTRLTDDVAKVQQAVQASIRLLFRAPMLFVGSVAMSLAIRVDVSIVIVSIMVASSVFVALSLRRAYPLFVALQSRRDDVSRSVRETVAGVRVAKAYCGEPLERARFSQANEALVRQSLSVSGLMSGLMPAVSFALNAGVAFIIYLGAGGLGGTGLNVGEIMAAISYLAQIQVAVMMASRVMVIMTQARASLIRVGEALGAHEEAEAGGLPFVNGDVVFAHVSFAYSAQASRLMLQDVSFSVSQGGTLAIMGETGAGKSTIVNLLAGLYAPAGGQVTIGGVSLSAIVRADLRRRVAVVMQGAALFAGTVRQNVTMGTPAASDADVWEALRLSEAEEFVRSLPGALQYHIERGGRNLSGGQRQRLSLARAIVRRPDVLILDDCLNALDAITERRVCLNLASMPCTKVIVSQRVSMVSLADQILLLEAGRVVAQGSHDALMRSCAAYRDVFLSQTAK